MQAHLDWQVGPGDGEAVAALPNIQVLPRQSRRGLAVTPRLIAFYISALVCAGITGFSLGRWAEAHATLTAELDRQVGLETLAWQGADEDLFDATLDPGAATGWRTMLRRTFRANAPQDYVLHIESITSVASDLVRVTLSLTTDAGVQHETRLYQARGQRWYRAPGDVGG
jgi:hypothetical protein